jgi:hypothetical protein
VLWCCERRSVFNLQAGVPSRRPSSDSVTAFIVNSSPSGQVPGDGVGSRGVERFIIDGGEGLARNFLLYFRVLCVIVEDLVIIFSFLEVLYVTSSPTV